MSILLTSDIHLDPKRLDIAKAFDHFLATTARECESLYLLGDIFEAWIGDDFSMPFVDQIKSALRAVSDSGVAVYFMHGNRDFLVGQDFCNDIGATLLDDPTMLEYGGQRILLMHGDNLCLEDVDYLEFRKMARNPAWQQQILSKSIPERIAIAEQMRNDSQDAMSTKSADIMDVTVSEVDRLLAKHQADLMIHGHTHRPNTHKQADDKQRIVLGDWDKSLWYLTLDENRDELAKLIKQPL
ncbi:UDP-2,3-diacylglucosamine hydrolase [Sinobacterium norvegicum]|uniref:UDP-2,3-diacylglucosamine hydrolase n=1 Tax=Sinobacterium norvegicum TaxID=1641715 RepID=A0ABM9AB34_9GAMM|nr:UDP-2,3-diacylglucosamine diphosphatase [Sinobacterium norvegicum]CAH0990168.1 UDP-2,3-diacylglucosamine hydrolase [Sinobacterium norvegicum]